MGSWSRPSRQAPDPIKPAASHLGAPDKDPALTENTRYLVHLDLWLICFEENNREICKNFVEFFL